jgi:hypothetical protein
VRAIREDRNVFLVGALVGVLGGLVLGSVATAGVGDKLRDLVLRLAARLFGDQENIRFELLGQ